MTEPTDRDVSWSVVFRLDDNDDWHDWTRNHADVSDAVKSAEVLAKTPPVVQIRFDRITVQRERFSLAELSAADDPAAVLPAPTDQTAVARVRALHQQYRFGGDDTTDYCAHCNQISGGWIPWPCPTVQALDGEQAAELRRLAGEAQQDGSGPEPCSACRYVPCETCPHKAQQDPTQDGTEA